MINMSERTKEELIGHDREIEDAIFDKYREIRSKNRDICNTCNRSVNILNEGHPVSFFVVGENFQKELYRIMFVGKTVQRGWEKDPIDSVSGFIDARKSAREQLFLPFWSTYPFWQCVKEVCQALWGTTNAEDLWKKIAITNLVKCSTSKDRDETPNLLRTNCIQYAKFFEEEAKIARPTHIIFFTGFGYDDFIRNIGFGYKYEDITSEKNCEDLGKNVGKVPWWHRKFSEMGKIKMQFLRTYHPGYLKKQSKQECFSRNIAEWIRNSSILK